MPTAFDLQFAASGFRSLLALHGERVWYKPLEGRERQITAIVTRHDIQPIDGMDSTLAPLILLEALDDERDADYGGINPERVNAGQDYVRLPVKQGMPAENKTVAKRIPSDGGVVRFEIR